jgi:hypothetical protein
MGVVFVSDVIQFILVDDMLVFSDEVVDEILIAISIILLAGG